MNKPTIVMPAIYRFNIKGCPKESQWGWHRATELVEAVNNILASQGKAPMSPIELAKKHPRITVNRTEWFGTVPTYHGTIIIDADGTAWEFRGDDDWIRSLVIRDCYLPARLGMQLIEAVKHPLRSKLLERGLYMIHG